MTKKKPVPSVAKQRYEPTSRERTAIEKYLTHNADNPAPRLKVLNEKISLDHPNELIGYALLMEALGTADIHFVNELLGQLANAGTQGRQIDERALNFMFSVIKSIKPRDQIETMLAAQMAAVHMATMTFSRRLAHVENIPQQDSAERAFNKLARTFATQMEALKRYRTGGEQKVTVQHVSVSDGGQAIVGNVHQATRETTAQKPASEPPALTDSKSAPMPILGEPAKTTVNTRRKAEK
jgi:hypothetical protein